MMKRRQIKNKPPRKVPINHTWGIDLTTVTLNNKQQVILGIIDHGSRLNLKLIELESKHSARILVEVCRAIRQFGLPKIIRSDNEACFTSKMMRIAFKLLGVKHQHSDVACPWQNGRIERFFGSFKEKIKQITFNNVDTFQFELDIFNVWYNQLRTHQNLGGLTPKEAWLNKQDKKTSQAVLATAWDGLLTGYYFPD
jgi:transposase InsO family protein